MAFDWTDYLQLARELAKYGTDAGHRSAVSRAYYYVYHLALSRAESNGFSYCQAKELMLNSGASLRAARMPIANIWRRSGID